MSVVMDRSILDRNINKIDFTQLDPFEELRKIQPRFMDIYDGLKGEERIFWLRSYQDPTPIEESLLQLALDKIEDPKISVTEESKVRRELAEMASKGIEVDSPEMEAEWQEKLSNARMLDAENLRKVKEERANAMKGKKIEKNDEDALSQVVGLGDKSIQKLNEAGIKNASEFHALSYEQKKIIVGPLVADKFKTGR